MKKVVFVLVVVVMLAVGVNASAAPCRNAVEVSREAYRLERASENLHRAIHRATGYSHLVNDAYALATEARQLHRSADRRWSCQRIREDYAGVRNAFRRLDAKMDRAHRIHHRKSVSRDWVAVKNAYYSTRNAVDRSRY